jgi:hypothetical protein
LNDVCDGPTPVVLSLSSKLNGLTALSLSSTLLVLVIAASSKVYVPGGGDVVVVDENDDDDDGNIDDKDDNDNGVDIVVAVVVAVGSVPLSSSLKEDSFLRRFLSQSFCWMCR